MIEIQFTRNFMNQTHSYQNTFDSFSFYLKKFLD